MAQASFTIKRSELRQGGPSITAKYPRGTGALAMRNPEGFMCCLGAIGLICGIPAEHMVNEEMPSDVLKNHPEHFGLPHMELFVTRQRNQYFEDENDSEDEFLFEDTLLSEEAAELNDDTEFTHEERERDLIARFANDDIELIIVD